MISSGGGKTRVSKFCHSTASSSSAVAVLVTISGPGVRYLLVAGHLLPGDLIIIMKGSQ